MPITSKSKILGKHLAALLGVVAFFSIPVFVLAQTADFGTGYLTGVGLGTQDIRTTIVNIIRVALGILGLITLGLILYAGFIWMTSAGKQDQITRAKKIIINAVIGLLIIILAAAITEFIFRQIQAGVYGGGGGATCTAGVCDITGCYRCNSSGTWDPDSSCGGTCSLGLNVFTLNTVHTTFATPGDKKNNVYLCSNIQPAFNNQINSNTAPPNLSSAEVVNTSTGVPVSGTWRTFGNTLHFKPDNNWAAGTTFEVALQTTLQDLGGDALANCAIGECESTEPPDGYFGWQFTTGSELDTTAPQLVSAYPVLQTAGSYPSQDVSRAPVIDVTYSENVDATTVSDGAAPNPHPLTSAFVLEELNAQNGSVVTTIDNNSLKVLIKSNGFQVRPITPFKLEPWTWYRITVDSVQDLCSNIMSPAPVVWEFQTNNNVPGVQGTYPANNANNVCPNVTPISFWFGATMYDEDILFRIADSTNTDVRTLSIRATESNTTTGVVATVGELRVANPSFPPNPVNNHYTVFEFLPDGNLLPNERYTVQIDAPNYIIDANGNPLRFTWSFNTSDASNCTCAPVITGLSPSQGPVGQCLTVQGYCFQGTPGNPGTISSATVDGQAAVIKGQGGNYATIDVPTTIGSTGLKPVQVEMTNGLGSFLSNTRDFNVNSLTPYTGPCLYSMTPNQACNGASINLSGERFGADPGAGSRDTGSENVTFAAYSQVPDPPDVPSWSPSSIGFKVPATYGTSDVFVTAGGAQSNSLPFTLQCGGPPGGGGFFDVTSVAPSCGTACPNSSILVTFNTSISTAPLQDADIDILPCTDGTCTGYGSEVPFGSYSITQSGNSLTITGLSLGYTQDYRVILRSGVKGVNGYSITNMNFDEVPPAGNDSYSWTFKTQATDCAITSVQTAPANMSFTTTGVTQQVVGLAYSNQGCGANNPIDPWPYAWTWWTDDAGIADVSHYNTVPPAEDPIQDVTANGVGTTFVHADANGFQDQTRVDVTLDFRATSWSPTCGTACPTSQLNVWFSSDVDPATVNTSNIILRQCTDSNCTAFSGGNIPVSIPPPLNNRVQINPNAALAISSYYRVIITNAVQGTNGVPVSNVNYDFLSGVPGNDSFSWTFGTSAVNCTIDSVDGHPDSSTIRGLGNTQSLWADALTTQGCGGTSYLNPWTYNWQWNSNDPAVATVTNVDTDTDGNNDPVQTASAVAIGSTKVDVLEESSGLSDVMTVNVTDPGGLGASCDADQGNSICDPDSTICQSQFYCDPGACTCADPPAPSILSVTPADGSSLECVNTAFQVMFNQPMKTPGKFVVEYGSSDPKPTIPVAVSSHREPNGINGCTWVDGCTVFTISLKGELPPGEPVVLDASASMESIYGKAHTGVGTATYNYTTTPTAHICELYGVDVNPPNRLFTSAVAPNNSQDFIAYGYSYIGGKTYLSPLPGVYEWTWDWTVDDPDGLVNVGPLTGNTTNATVPARAQGTASITANATITTDTVFNGNHLDRVRSGSALLDVFICDFPWPDPPAYTIGGYNAAMKYCRGFIGDAVLLPTLQEHTLSVTEPDLLYDRFFVVSGTQGNVQGSDIIGLRVFDNPNHSSAAGWYQSRGFAQGSPSETVVDGYSAVVDGRTTYIHFTNISGSGGGGGLTAYSYILVLSYSDGATQETMDIYNLLKKDLRFNTNVTPTDKVNAQEDHERIGGIGTIVELIRQTGTNPSLNSGTFINGMSTSKWPSWQSRIGNKVGRAIPVDPDNSFAGCPSQGLSCTMNSDCPSGTRPNGSSVSPSCSGGVCQPNGYDSASCFNVNLNPQFYCPDGSHIYIYRDGRVYGNLKYKNLTWNGISGSASSDTCYSFSISTGLSAYDDDISVLE